MPCCTIATPLLVSPPPMLRAACVPCGASHPRHCVHCMSSTKATLPGAACIFAHFLKPRCRLVFPTFPPFHPCMPPSTPPCLQPAPLHLLRQGLGYTAGKDLFGFGYDFRQSCRAHTQRLVARLEEASKHSEGRKVTRGCGGSCCDLEGVLPSPIICLRSGVSCAVSEVQ